MNLDPGDDWPAVHSAGVAPGVQQELLNAGIRLAKIIEASS
jgi:hypothetical protein